MHQTAPERLQRGWAREKEQVFDRESSPQGGFTNSDVSLVHMHAVSSGVSLGFSGFDALSVSLKA